jgi:hypothetical protein
LAGRTAPPSRLSLPKPPGRSPAGQSGYATWSVAAWWSGSLSSSSTAWRADHMTRFVRRRCVRHLRRQKHRGLLRTKVPLRPVDANSTEAPAEIVPTGQARQSLAGAPQARRQSEASPSSASVAPRRIGDNLHAAVRPRLWWHTCKRTKIREPIQRRKAAPPRWLQIIGSARRNTRTGTDEGAGRQGVLSDRVVPSCPVFG